MSHPQQVGERMNTTVQGCLYTVRLQGDFTGMVWAHLSS